MCKKAKSLSKQLEKNAKIDYLLSEILNVLGVAGGALLIVEIFAGTICLGAVSAGLGIILGMTTLAVSMDDYCQTMRLYADACEDTPKGEAARQQLEKNAKIDTAWAIAGVVGAGAVKFTVNAVRRSGLGKKVGEEIATLFVKNGGDVIKVDEKIAENAAKGYAESVTVATSGYGNYPQITDDVFVAFNKNSSNISSFNSVKNLPPTKVPADKIAVVKNVRDAIPAPAKETMMSKAVAKSEVENYVKEVDGWNTIRGFTAKTDDLAGLKTYRDYYDGLKLNYTGSKFSPAEDNVMYIIEFKTSEPEKVLIPYSKEYRGVIEYGSSGYTAPYTGNGFTASERFLIPEYEIPKGNAAKIETANIYPLDKFGNKKLYATFKNDKFVEVAK